MLLRIGQKSGYSIVRVNTLSPSTSILSSFTKSQRDSMSDPTDPDKSSSNPLFGAPAPPPPESTSVSTAPSLPADTNLPKPSSETVDPLFGASPPQDTSNSTSPAPHQPNGSTPSLPPSETVDPLFGASPPADTSNPAPTNLEDSSRDRIHSLKLARDSTLNSTAPVRLERPPIRPPPY